MVPELVTNADVAAVADQVEGLDPTQRLADGRQLRLDLLARSGLEQRRDSNGGQWTSPRFSDEMLY